MQVSLGVAGRMPRTVRVMSVEEWSALMLSQIATTSELLAARLHGEFDVEGNLISGPTQSIRRFQR